MSRILPFLPFVLFLPVESPAQTDSLSLGDKIADLQKHVIPLDTIDVSAESFSDLTPLREHIGDRRIVVLGEPTHGDGTAFRAKGRLVKFLHQEMNFGVLAFENGLYDLRLATERASTPDEHVQAARGTLARPWAESKQVRPLLRLWNGKAGSRARRSPGRWASRRWEPIGRLSWMDCCSFACIQTRKSSRRRAGPCLSTRSSLAPIPHRPTPDRPPSDCRPAP